MHTLQIDKQTAQKLFPTASNELKKMFINTFGNNFFQQNIIERLQNFDDCCEAIGEDPDNEKFFNGTPDEIAYKKLKVIIRAFNEE